MSAAPSIDPPARTPRPWRCGPHAIDLSTPRLMGIVNVTPDSFSDHGAHFDPAVALDHARRLIANGADILDIGGESTRPGAPEVPVDEELRRVIPLIEALRDSGVPISIDTSKPAVMRAALAAGACIVNDVWALRQPGAAEVVAASDCGVVLMHMQGTPRTMQSAPQYADVVVEVGEFLQQRRDALRAHGVAADRIALDPGFGFGKTPEHNWTLLTRMRELIPLGPVVAGLSRKSMLGHATGRAVTERVVASAAAALVAVQHGAAILRVHDVAATRDALAVLQAVQAASPVRMDREHTSQQPG
jgi:dihydropteroate synthase